MTALPKHSNNWNKITPPLRPTPAVAAAFRALSKPGKTLMFGVTPELHAVFPDLLAVDGNPEMIRSVWPGDTLLKKAQVGEWMDMGFAPRSFANVIGDGAITMLSSQDNIRKIQNEAYKWLEPGGIFIHRLFETPSETISKDSLIEILNNPATINWNAFKVLMMFHQAQTNNYVNYLPGVLDLFNEIAPDRDAVCTATGWDRSIVDTIDLYQGIGTITYKPNRAQWIDMIPEDAVNINFHIVPGYDLCEMCPIMTWEKKR